MRIFHILNHTQRCNGHVCAVVDLASTQAKAGHEVYVCSRGGDFDHILQKYGITHVKIDQDRKIGTLASAIGKIHKSLREIDPDIVHAHMMTSALLSALLKPFMRFRLVTTVHNSFQKSSVLMRVGQRVIAVSEAVRQTMINRGIPSKKIRTVLNGTINTPRHAAVIPQPVSLQHPALIFLGGLHPRKGVDILIRAFGAVSARHPNAHLYIVGGGPFRNEYEDLARSISPSGITFCGVFEDPRPYLREADIFVLPTLADPAPLVITEAREAGCAIVASDVDGVPELLDHGKAGILVPPKNTDALAEALLKLLDDPAYLAVMRQKSQENLSYYMLDRVAQETQLVYQELLDERKRA